MKNHKLFLTAVFILVSTTFSIRISADESSQLNGSLSILGGLGVSTAGGSYPADYNAEGVFSFYPGLRAVINNIPAKSAFIILDVGYLETGFRGYVFPTSSSFYNTYEYININLLAGGNLNKLYYAAGFYLGPGLDSYGYSEYTDEWTYFDSNSDFGLAVETGYHLAPFISLGLQARYGLKSISTSVDIKNIVLLAMIQIHFLNF